MNEYWSGVTELDGADAEEHWVAVEPEVSIRVMIWKPRGGGEPSEGTVVMVPGWGSMFRGMASPCLRVGEEQASGLH